MATVDCDEMSAHPRIIAVESASVVTSFDDSNSMDEDTLNGIKIERNYYMITFQSLQWKYKSYICQILEMLKM